MNGRKLWIFPLTFLSYFLLTNHVQSQCWIHSPTEAGKNLVVDMIKNPPHRWFGTTMDYRVRSTARFWYGTDIWYAANQWNNSSYKGTSTVFRFNDDGSTNAPVDYPDLNNVIGIKDMPQLIVAQAHTWFWWTGEIYECDININSISWTIIQPHAYAGPNDYCVRNALCHEFGHALGLSHLDQSNEYIPDTMYFDIDPGEHKKESLECDDKWGIWYTYDSGSVPPPNAPSVHHLLQPSLDRTPPPIEKGTIPTMTELVGNYPNPFNPETWIAYKLAQESDVTIRIYGTKGQVVRMLQLGSKPAGVYVDQESAAYWDGKTEAGEAVSSGVYFYSLITDHAIYTKRMVIDK